MLFHVGISERLHILTLRLGRQSAQMSKITNDCLTRSGTGLGLCSIAIMIAIYRRVVPAIAVDH